MMNEEFVKIVVYVPSENADKVREALAESGCGKMGNYDFCSFSLKGVGRFRPLKGANPAIGTVDEIEEVGEERIETICRKDDLEKVKAAVKRVHPYEEPVIDVFGLIG